jgi:acetyl esterase/lipase
MNLTVLLEQTSHALPLWDEQPIEDAFTLTSLDQSNSSCTAVVTSVTRPWLLAFAPTSKPNNRAILILGGGGYIELMVGREGIQVARWLASLGYHTFVLIHRFPKAETGAQAPLDDARQALRLIHAKGFALKGLGVCGLSSGGHLGAALLAKYPEQWTDRIQEEVPEIEFAIIGYAPISTNAVGRQIVPNKAPLEPPEKQKLYDTVQPDVQLRVTAPSTFVVYAGNDQVVPVVNAYRLAEGLGKAGAAVELHVFADAPHGFGVDTLGLPVSGWTGMCEAWMRQNGLLG